MKDGWYHAIRKPNNDYRIVLVITSVEGEQLVGPGRPDSLDFYYFGPNPEPIETPSWCKDE